MSEVTDKLNKIYEKYENDLSHGFHNLLWQIMVNESCNDRTIAFTVIVDEFGHQLVFADKGMKGYNPTNTYFQKTIPYKRANEIAADLNKEVLGLNADQALTIVASSI